MSPQERYDTIVIGSGFGGAIAACRLAEAGQQVLILERGPERQGSDFPRIGKAGVQEWLWTSRWNGFFDLRVFRRIATLSSSGVGGGSHAYANVHIRAPEQTFSEGWPQGFGPQSLSPYYERVEHMLGVQPLPEVLELPKTRAYERAAQTISTTLRRPNLAVFFGDDPVAAVASLDPWPVHDPYGFGIDIEQAPCRMTGECDIGCAIGAKNSLDRNYLAIARQRYGAVLRPLSEVVAVKPSQDGYRVFYQDRLSFARSSVWAKRVVISAGTVNTLELLLRCRDEFQLLPKLGTALGERFSGNADFLCAALNTAEALEPWNGPVITRALEWQERGAHFYLQEGGFAPDLAFLVAAMRPNSDYVNKLLKGPIGQLAQLRWFYSEIAELAKGPHNLKERLPSHTMIFLGMGQDASDGRVSLKSRLGRRPKLDIEWDHGRTKPLLLRMEAEFRRITEALGGTFVTNPLWGMLGRLITVHPLGGAALADDPAAGLLSPEGEVWGYPNLYVADGAAVPRAIGPNPAHTIAALSERIAEGIVRRG